MEKNIVQEIWEIRGKVDECIKTKKYSKLQTYLELLRDYKREKKHHLTETSVSFGYAFWSPKYKYDNMDRNFDSIISNMENIVSKFSHSRDVSIKYGDKHDLSILEYVWICRSMYDDVMSKIGTPKEDKERNIEILYYVEEKLRALANANGFRIWLNEDEKLSMHNIYRKVGDTYSQVYAHRSPLQGFSKISQDF